MSAGNLLFFEVTFQKGRRREGGEDSWRVNRDGRADGNGRKSHRDCVDGDSSGSFPSVTTQQSHPGPHATPGKDRAL